MLKSADTSLKKLEKHYPKNSTLKQTLTVIVSHIRESRLERQNRAGSKWVTAHGSASRIMAEQREVHCRRGQE
jgi:cAMP phosphodiesterase